MNLSCVKDLTKASLYVITIDDMTLKWYREGDSICASGRRGYYTIADRSFGTKKLTAVGYDGLPFLDLPPFGALLTSQPAAVAAAEELDSRRFIEAQMSGT